MNIFQNMGSQKIFLEPFKPSYYLPMSYDFRMELPECYSENMIRDQADCGGCWAFATASTYTARTCKKYKGLIRSLASAQYLISCDSTNSACDGGNRYKALETLQRDGIVPEYCLPYTSADGRVAACTNQCQQKEYTFSKFKIPQTPIRVLTSINEIKNEIITNGPVAAGFITYIDLSSYRGGVYIPSTTQTAERHAVVLLGWDLDRFGVEHWIIQNSWGPAWGENGYFRMPFNIGEISNSVYAADV